MDWGTWALWMALWLIGFVVVFVAVLVGVGWWLDYLERRDLRRRELERLREETRQWRTSKSKD